MTTSGLSSTYERAVFNELYFDQSHPPALSWAYSLSPSPLILPQGGQRGAVLSNQPTSPMAKLGRETRFRISAILQSWKFI